VDPAHDFLSVRLIRTKDHQVAVVSPNGANATGFDLFWRNYARTAKTPDGQVVTGRFAAAELSATFMKELILAPQIHTHELQPEVLSRHFADSQLPYRSKHSPAARLLFVSSHGWQSGSMKGDSLKPDSNQPSETSRAYDPETPYFLLGAEAEKGVGFRGPDWIILAQCSTLNSSTWPLWARILGRSSPGVRGILAYEEASPKPEPAVVATERFFKYLDQGATFLDAWKQGQSLRHVGRPRASRGPKRYPSRLSAISAPVGRLHHVDQDSLRRVPVVPRPRGRTRPRPSPSIHVQDRA
jgi:hypothetical protein